MVAFIVVLAVLLVLACALSIRERMRWRGLEAQPRALRGRVRTGPDLVLRTRAPFSEPRERELLRRDLTRPPPPVTFHNMQVGLIGAGNMARAMARGWGDPVLCSDSGSGRARALAQELGGEALDSNAAVAQRADLVVLCHKPAQLEPVAH